jgi:hypothetical protein
LVPWRGREWLGDLDWSPRVDIAAADRTFLIKAKITGGEIRAI